MTRLALALLLTLAALTPVEAARPVATQASLGRVGTRRVSVNGVRVREEGHLGVRGEGRFITPNEIARVFAPALRGRAASGSVLAVGTFRGLEDAVHALEGVDGVPKDFHLIQLDIDAGITRFNAANATAIAHAEDRASYRADLAGVAQPRSYLATGWRSLPKLPLPGLPARARAQGLLAATIRASSVHWRPLGEYLEALENIPDEDAQTLLGDDARFAKVQALARGGRVRAINGSIIGDRTMRDLGHALRARGERLSVIDLSNAGDWLATGRAGDADGALRRLADNLEALPLSHDAVVLLTSERDHYSRAVAAPPPSGVTVGWAYHAIPAKDFLKVLRAPATGQGWRADRWFKMLDDSTAASTENARGLRWAPGARSYAAPPSSQRANDSKP